MFIQCPACRRGPLGSRDALQGEDSSAGLPTCWNDTNCISSQRLSSVYFTELDDFGVPAVRSILNYFFFSRNLMVPLPVWQILPNSIQSAELPCGSSEPPILSPALAPPLSTEERPGCHPSNFSPSTGSVSCSTVETLDFVVMS